MIARVDLARLNDTERKALFLNAYNVFAMSKLLDNSCDGQLCDRCVTDSGLGCRLTNLTRGSALPPVFSIHDIGNFVCPVWYQKAGVVGGRSFSLDNIEDDYLTTHFHDARVHGGKLFTQHTTRRCVADCRVVCSQPNIDHGAPPHCRHELCVDELSELAA